MGFVVGVDVGGTFTDGVAVDDQGNIISAKTPSTPPDYSAGVFNVLALLAEQFSMSREQFLQATDHIAHGTTSSLNALVMGKVPPVGFITTRGHGDSIAIMNVEGRYLGRSSMELQNVLGHAKPAPLVAKRLIKEVSQRMDREGNLRVGPLSAQAAPGPACYGAGGKEPTITDANLVLGILPSRGLLGGQRPLSLELAREAIHSRIAQPLGLSVEEAAAAIYAVQNAQTGDLLRKIAVEAGHDPRDFVVYAFGGAGPAHCAAYTAAVGSGECLVPLGPVASAFSAFGLAASSVNVIRELSDPGVAPLDPVRVAENFQRLEDEVSAVLARQGIKFVETQLFREIDMRYGMQMGEVATPIDAGPITAQSLQEAADKFEQLYAQQFGAGSGFRDAGIQALTYRVRGEGILPISPELPEIEAANGTTVESALIEHRPICLDAHKGFVETPAYDYTRLRAGHRIEGPAVIQVPTTTVVVPGGMHGVIDRLGNLSITTNAA